MQQDETHPKYKGEPLVKAGGTAISEHPLAAMIQHYERQAYTDSFRSPALQAGDCIKVLVLGSSPLGLNVVSVPENKAGLVYNDEAGFVPDASGQLASAGDVVPASCPWPSMATIW